MIDTLKDLGIWFIGSIIGVIATYIYFKFKQIDNDIRTLESMIPTAEDVAKAVINMKIPISDLPPEVQEQLAREANMIKSSGLPNKNPLVG